MILLAFAAGLATMSKFVPNPGAFYAYVTSGLGKHAGLGGAFLAIFAYWLIATATYAFFGSATNGSSWRSVDPMLPGIGGRSSVGSSSGSSVTETSNCRPRY